MLKKDITSFNTDIFTLFDKKWAIITAGDKTAGFNAMTVSWGGLGTLWNKSVAYIFVRKSRYTHEFLEKSDSITISFMNEKYRNEMALFGRKSGKDIDKFKETNLHPSFEPDYNGYFVAEADCVLKCKKIMSTDIEYDKLPDYIKTDFYPDKDIHTMYVVEVKQFLVNEE
jgi:flavin reductase (DIM6/NTAB) family NADH-FMN oxidoreductase RutF